MKSIKTLFFLSITLLASFAGVQTMNIVTPESTTVIPTEGVTVIKALSIAHNNPNHPLSQNLYTILHNTVTSTGGSIGEMNNDLQTFNNSQLMHQIANSNTNQLTLAAQFNETENDMLTITLLSSVPGILTACNAILDAQNNNNQNNQE